MNLLPASLEEFRKRSYWNDFFRSRGDNAFEWYGSYADYKAILDSLDLRTPAGRRRPRRKEQSQEASAANHTAAPCTQKEETAAGGEPDSTAPAPAANGSQVAGSRILHVGCGNSELPRELVEDGYSAIVNVDFSSVVIANMCRRCRHLGSALEWECLDVRKGALAKKFGAEAFDVVLDKGFLDAYISGDQEQPAAGGAAPAKAWDYRQEAQEYLQSVLHVLKPGGVYILVTLAQDYLAKELVRCFHAAPVSDVIIFPLSHKACPSSSSSPLPYLFAFTKNLTSSPAEDGQPVQLTKRGPKLTCTVVAGQGRAGGDETFSIWELPKRIVSINKWRFFQSAIHVYQPGSRSTVSVHRQKRGNEAEESAAYSIAIYDRVFQEATEEKNKKAGKKDGKKGEKKKSAAHKTAALFAPLGQECSWLYSTPEGNEELALQAGVSRLLVVTAGVQGAAEAPTGAEGLHEQKPSVFEKMKDELEPYLADLALPGSGTIPVLIVSEGSSVHAELARIRSPYAGCVVVRDVECDDENPDADRILVLRQMIFSCNPQAVQSEVKVLLPASETSGEAPQFLFCQPSCAYHLATAAAFALLPAETTRLSATLLGLGGGILARLLSLLFGRAFDLQLTCVDLDPVVVQLAKECFGFEEAPPAVTAVTDDALSFLAQLPASSQDVLIIDINNGSSSSSLTCPSEDFVQPSVLETLKARLAAGGLLIFNLLSRCPQTKKQILDRLTAMFPFVSAFGMPDDVNELVVCSNQLDAHAADSAVFQTRVDSMFKKVAASLPECAGDARRLASDAALWSSWSRRWRVNCEEEKREN
ncbi:hypothetical protein BESB_066890 [Besnoitia besnoiti]|uniref:Methyltransferase domain-containing protein n=1 Tax=Besnoitia besnoiti TaxID=94643 RepID=A0A2A9MFC4_BESBE|nr:hypothetical protein BESB_066890 [Besnoitia besnoiti]PFH34656.1 hypothetical protein BESB_066890 [Besnoitia besnoiti]